MWILFGSVGFLVLLWLVRLAINPIGTAVNTLRVLLFILSSALFILWLTLSEKQDANDFEVLWFSLIVAGLWLLTFILPAVARRAAGRRQ
ncbi:MULTISPECIES: hypothetical protein [unclassified Glutamicibacter]|uniref:hypothetical protein n=1 Tax=unclassified Glutamicibacter TaxID=2627139 RepID=UPI002FC7ABC6